MNLFQVNERTLSLRNFDRIDEEVLFNQLKHKLLSISGVTLGKKITGPNEDLYEGKYNDFEFTLIYDINYGDFITSESKECLKKLLEKIND